jgi:hypothetical protein
VAVELATSGGDSDKRNNSAVWLAIRGVLLKVEKQWFYLVIRRRS